MKRLREYITESIIDEGNTPEFDDFEKVCYVSLVENTKDNKTYLAVMGPGVVWFGRMCDDLIMTTEYDYDTKTSVNDICKQLKKNHISIELIMSYEDRWQRKYTDEIKTCLQSGNGHLLSKDDNNLHKVLVELEKKVSGVGVSFEVVDNPDECIKLMDKYVNTENPFKR